MDYLAEYQSVTKIYPTGWLGTGRLPAVREVSFHIAHGEVFGLLGPNRAGKTTLVKMLLSLTEPTKGRVLRLGQPTADMSTLGQIGYMHEVHAYPQYLTPSSLLDYYGSLGLMEPETIHRRIPELLKMVGLWGQRDMPLSQFSKGMRQRAALAQALLNDPDLLIFDEPSEGLDLQGRQLIREVVSQRRKLGKSVFLISHILSEVEKLCDRVGVLTEGRLVYLGDISGLTTTPQGKVRPLEQAVRGFYETTPLESEQHAEVVG